MTDSSQSSWLEEEIRDPYSPVQPDGSDGRGEPKSDAAAVFCQFCNTRIDEKGWCGCDTIGGD